MSTEPQAEEDDLEQRVRMFLHRNFPQIQMHGGSAAIQEINRDTGEVTIALGGACSGCGISPMTIQAIKSRMVKEIPEVEKVNATTGMGGPQFGHSEGGRGGSLGGMSPSFPGDGEEDEDEDRPQAPF